MIEIKPPESVKWWSSPRALLRTLLMLDDTPHSVALGLSIGILFGMTPTVGLQMIMVVLFSLAVRRLFDFNRVAALVGVYVSNPLTAIPLYWFNYKVGTYFVEGDLDRDAFSEMFAYHGFEQWWEAVTTIFVDIGKPLLVGSLVVGVIAALITYPLTIWALKLFHGTMPPAPPLRREPAIAGDPEP